MSKYVIWLEFGVIPLHGELRKKVANLYGANSLADELTDSLSTK